MRAKPLSSRGGRGTLASRSRDVDLRHLGAGAIARVAHLEADGDREHAGGRRSRPSAEIRVLELGVAATEAEREERLDRVGVEVPVADEDALAVLGDALGKDAEGGKLRRRRAGR